MTDRTAIEECLPRDDVVHRRCGDDGRNVLDLAGLCRCSLIVWTRYYSRSFGKEQCDEARARMLEYGFGAVEDAEPEATLDDAERDAAPVR